MAYVEALTTLDIDFGRLLWQELRRSKTFPAVGAFWLFDRESGECHLLIASPRVDLVGPRKAYEELSAITRRIPADSTQLLRIELISPKLPLYEAFLCSERPHRWKERDLATRRSVACTSRMPICMRFANPLFIDATI